MGLKDTLAQKIEKYKEERAERKEYIKQLNDPDNLGTMEDYSDEEIRNLKLKSRIKIMLNSAKEVIEEQNSAREEQKNMDMSQKTFKEKVDLFCDRNKANILIPTAIGIMGLSLAGHFYGTVLEVKYQAFTPGEKIVRAVEEITGKSIYKDKDKVTIGGYTMEMPKEEQKAPQYTFEEGKVEVVGDLGMQIPDQIGDEQKDEFIENSCKIYERNKSIGGGTITEQEEKGIKFCDDYHQQKEQTKVSDNLAAKTKITKEDVQDAINEVLSEKRRIKEDQELQDKVISEEKQAIQENIKDVDTDDIEIG